jgi:hypothetical protein
MRAFIMESIMARTTEETPSEPRVQPNIKAIMALLGPGGDIEKAEKKAAEGNTATGSIYQKIEKNLNGNRAAVSMVRRMMKMSDDKRADFIRTVEPLMVELGFTLDAIDPEDLVAQANASSSAPAPADGDEKGDDQPDGGGENEALNGLDAARARLGGGEGSEAARQRANEKNGSVNLRKLIGALRAGRSLEESVELSGIPMEEAKDHEAAEQRGEYAALDAIAPAPKKGRAKLGIVPGGVETVQ